MARKTQAQIEFKVVTTEFSSGIKEMNSSIKTMNNELKLNSAQLKNNSDDVDLLQKRQSILQRKYEATSQKIELTEKSLEQAKRLLGENSAEYKRLNNAVLQAKTAQQNIQNELDQTSDKIEKINQSTKESEGGFRGFINNLKKAGSGARESEGGFTTLKGAIAEFAGNVLTEATSKISEFVGSLFELADETEEFRTNMAKLDGSTSQYGYSADFTNSKVKELYGYFKDDQVAVNALTNLQGMELSQKELSNTLNAGIAVWTAYGDSIPIEGLTESINESSQVGKVTGSLADALNWAGISEDDFNKKLEKCNSTKDRAKLITDTLNKAYGESKSVYDENTKSLRENNEAEMELIQAQAELGEAMEPVNTAITELKVSALQAITPVIITVAGGIQSLIEKFQGLPAPVQQAIGVGALVVGAIIAIIAVVGMLTPILGLLASGAGIVAGAIGAISLPVLAVVAVIGVLIAIGVTLYKNWDTVKAKAVSIWNGIKTTIGNVCNGIKTSVSNAFSSVVNIVKNKFNLVKTTITNTINSAKNIVSNGLNKIKGFFSNCKLSFPKIKLPHFSISGKLSINPPSVPKLNVKWYEKGGIMTQPTVFRTTGTTLHVGGEKGQEAILPLSNFYNYLDNKLNSLFSLKNTSIDYDKLAEAVVKGMKYVKIDMDGKEVGKITDKHAGQMISFIERGLNID